MDKTARRMDIDVRIASKAKKHPERKKLPMWFSYSIKHFEVYSPDSIDMTLAKCGVDGDDVVSITTIKRHTYGPTLYKVFYKSKRL